MIQGDLIRVTDGRKKRSRIEAQRALREGLLSPLYRFRLNAASVILGRRAWRDILLPDPPKMQMIKPVPVPRNRAENAVLRTADEYAGKRPDYCRGYPDCFSDAGEDPENPDGSGPCEHCALMAAVENLRKQKAAHDS